MKEIGGYMSLDEACGTEYHHDAIALNTAANCLRYIIRARKIQKIYIPYFLCSSVMRACVRENCEYEYYHINKSFIPLFNKELKSNEYLYVVNFYGQVNVALIKDLKDRYNNVIVDNVQAFFNVPIDNIDTLYSCRKFFGVPDGAYLYTDNKLKELLEIDVSNSRMEHILGRYEQTAQEYYSVYSENEKKMGQEPIKLMSKLTRNLMKSIDYERIKKRRTDNFKYLHNELKSINKLDLTVPEGAFMYPLYIENGMELKKKLIHNNIFVPTLWKDVFDIVGKESLEYDLAEKIVPLPIDQRYDIKDMEYIVENIRRGVTDER